MSDNLTNGSSSVNEGGTEAEAFSLEPPGALTGAAPEIVQKLGRVRDRLARTSLDGALLWERGNFAWITGGAENHVANDTRTGVAAILVLRHEPPLCLADEIEAPRMREEELAGRGLEVVSFPWWDEAAARARVRDVIGGRKVACDVDPMGLGLDRLPPDFATLRWTLLPEEIDRYRQGAGLASRAVERAALDVQPGMTEHEVAALLDGRIRAAGCTPLVTLVGADERVRRYRHPIPTDLPVSRYVMLVTCASFSGLVASLTRCVSLESLPDDLARRHQVACDVDAAVNRATVPGRSLGEVFRRACDAYTARGFAEEWKLHHQGGPTGYATRERIATPDDEERVRESQAFAWNPSITGVKSEDTVLCTSAGLEVLTAHSRHWPGVTGEFEGETLERPGILVR